MQYAILCYDAEDVVFKWTKEEDELAMQKLGAVNDKLAAAGRLGPVARLASTKSARTLRKGSDVTVLDGPFAEAKEQLLGFYIVDCESIEQAVETAKELARASNTKGAYEIRPVTYLRNAK